MGSGFFSIFIFFLNAADAKINSRQYLNPWQALEPTNYFLGKKDPQQACQYIIEHRRGERARLVLRRYDINGRSQM
jgi:hypothetical protein